MKKAFVAEIKTVSPYGFKSVYTEAQLANLAMAYGDIISVHTDPLWGGSMTNIEAICQRMGMTKEILAKGIHPTDEYIEAALDYHADYVLVVGRIPAKKYLSKCWLEPVDPSQYKAMARARPHSIVLNSRVLKDNSEQYWDVITKPHGVSLVQASNIKTVADVKSWADAFIVGSNLPGFILNHQMSELASGKKIR